MTLNTDSIGSFPVPWADLLVDKLGAIDFCVEHLDQKQTSLEWLGIVSSHQRKLGFASQEWQDSLQSALQLAKRQHWGILCARNAPYFQVLLHACQRFSLPIRVIQVDYRTKGTHSGQGNDQSSVSTEATVVRLIPRVASPKLVDVSQPLHDRAVVFLAERLFVLELRKGGKISDLLKQRLETEAIPSGSTYLALPSSHSQNKRDNSSSIEWLDRGVVGWLNIRSKTQNDTGIIAIIPNRNCATYQPLLAAELLSKSQTKYLIHCTRSRRGPWPEQSMAQFHDELLTCPWDSQPTVMKTLERILQQRRLIATHAYRRGSTPTVCFTENSIQDLATLRRFQPHLARWDWEPYGIMIDREWLIQHGAKRVVYVDRNAAMSLKDEQLTFCQTVSSESGATNWREEREWRLSGDLRLATIPFSRAMVFVATKDEALQLRGLSRWPIAYWSHA